MILLFAVEGVFGVMLEFILRPWHVVVLFLASRLNQEQQRAIEYLQAENEVLREKLGTKNTCAARSSRVSSAPWLSAS